MVSDCLKAYQLIASGWLKKLKNLKKIALTGSVGKTTTKEILKSILSPHFKTIVTHKNHNNEIGVCQTLLALTETTKFLVLEMGARQKGDIKTLTKMVKPDLSLCLNAQKAHVGIFGRQRC